MPLIHPIFVDEMTIIFRMDTNENKGHR